MKRRLLRILLGFLVLLLLAAALPARRVGDDAMAFSTQRGEWVWIVPGRVRKADVVLLRDPLDRKRKVLRRVVAVGGDRVRYEDGVVRVNGKRIRQTDMGVQGEAHCYKEVIWSKPPARANPYFVRKLIKPVKWRIDGRVIVPEGHLYVLADNRDQAMDSRWWGPVPEDAVLGVARFRVGRKDLWRPWAELLLPEE